MSAVTMQSPMSQKSPLSGRLTPASQSVLRRQGYHWYERKVAVSAAGMFDWNIGSVYNQPILPGQHNAFPRRIPSAGSEKLRQMYLNTDTVSGRLVFNTASERCRQRRLSVLQKTLEEQARRLEERNRQHEDSSSLLQQRQHQCTHLNRPSTTSRLEGHTPRRNSNVVPPIRSWKGLTIIKESRQLHLQGTSTGSDVDGQTSPLKAEEKISAEMSIYLPRADIQEDNHSIQDIHERKTSHIRHKNVAKQEVITPRHHQKLDSPKVDNQFSCSNNQTELNETLTLNQSSHSRQASKCKRPAMSRKERPLTANW